jgi:FMN reductase (NADPH)
MPTTLPDPSPTLDLLLQHRSIRRFKDTPIDDAHVRRAVQAGQQASTSSNVQAYSLLRVRDPKTLERLVELTGGQTKVARCGAFFVACGDTRRHRLLAARADLPYASHLEGFLVSVIDASLFAQNLCVAFESLGYGICYIGGVRNDLPAVQRLLHFPHGVYPLFGLCVGVPDEDPAPRPRLSPDAVLFEERYPDDAALLAGVDAYDDAMRGYYAARGTEGASWSQRIEAQFKAPYRTDAAAYYAAQGADLR